MCLWVGNRPASGIRIKAAAHGNREFEGVTVGRHVRLLLGDGATHGIRNAQSGSSGSGCAAGWPALLGGSPTPGLLFSSRSERSFGEWSDGGWGDVLSRRRWFSVGSLWVLHRGAPVLLEHQQPSDSTSAEL